MDDNHQLPDDLDDELFPACTAERVGMSYTDEYGVHYICGLVDELGYGWVALGRSPRLDAGPQ